MAAALLAWAMAQGKLDLKSFTFVISSPIFLPVNLLALLVAALLFGSLRFQLMLRLCEVVIPYSRAVRYQGIGLFANVFMPSAVGGDALKAFYVKSDYRVASVPKIILSVMLDRIVGMMSLFLIGAVVSFFSLEKLRDDPNLSHLIFVNVIFLMGTLGFFFVCWLLARFPQKGERTLMRLESRVPRLHKILSLLKDATQLIGRNPRIIGATVVISLVNQLIMMFVFWFITGLFGGQNIPFSTIAVIYPIGSLILVLPLTPGGAGVGHVAFDRLFLSFGYTGGANYFNIYFLGGLCFNLLMMVFYLTHSKVALPAEDMQHATP